MRTTLSPVHRYRRSGRYRSIILGCLVGFILAVGAHAAFNWSNNHFHVVIPGRLFRSAQQSAEDLERTIRAHGIRTVINLRGFCDEEWYPEQRAVTRHMGVAMEDVGLYCWRSPPQEDVCRLIRILDEAEGPILIHCRSGIDRTGWASAVALLLQDGTDPQQASRQLSLVYGYFYYGKARCLYHFFESYAEWLNRNGQEHTPNLFRFWVRNCYEAPSSAD
jgi:protein tyrosine/serine phosphatase